MNAQTPNLPAMRLSLTEIVAEYEAKRDGAAEAIATFETAIVAIKSAGTVSGTYTKQVSDARAPYLSSLQQSLLESAWKCVYEGLNIKLLSTASERKKFEQALAKPAPFTLDNIRATFGHYVRDPRFHILRGLAEVFTNLDPSFKSHSKVKIGKAGMQKRIILSSVTDYGAWGTERLMDLLNALAVFQGKPALEWKEMADFLRMAKTDDVCAWLRGVSLKRYQNGNGHVIFPPRLLTAVNRALAEFYGEVLPDMETDDPVPRQQSTAVAKDLQFYWTPEKVIGEILNGIGLRDGWRVLEPSCGDGRILDALRKDRHRLDCVGVEVHPGRAAEARAKGHRVHLGNFLVTEPEPVFDLVVMNPPFYGRHWVKHLEHAWKFVKPGGYLVSILPASAQYDGDKELEGSWHDLPVASFSEAGTNVPTGYVTRWKSDR